MVRFGREGIECRWQQQQKDSRKKKPEEARPEANVVRVLREQVEQKLTKEGVKASLGDYIRLVQLQKELEEEQPREIKVTWVEPKGAEESDSGE